MLKFVLQMYNFSLEKQEYKKDSTLSYKENALALKHIVIEDLIQAKSQTMPYSHPV